MPPTKTQKKKRNTFQALSIYKKMVITERWRALARNKQRKKTFNLVLRFSSSMSRRSLSSEKISIKFSCSLFISSIFRDASSSWWNHKQQFWIEKRMNRCHDSLPKPIEFYWIDNGTPIHTINNQYNRELMTALCVRARTVWEPLSGWRCRWT